MLSPDVLQVGEDVHVAPADDLLQHGVDHNVAACPSHPGTERGEERLVRVNTIEPRRD